MLAEKIGIKLKIIPLLADGALDLTAYEQLFSTRTRLVTVTHASNALGIINPVKEMVALAHQHDVPVLLDGAQAVPHFAVDVQAINCDFYAFSSHKLYGPTGIGVLYGKKQFLEALPPHKGGGDMIETVSFSKVTYAPLPQKFEAGTPAIVEAVGLQAAIDYLNAFGMEAVYAHEQQLLDYAQTALSQIAGLRLIGTAKPKVGVISFTMDGIHPHDLSTILDHAGIAVRAGHHCAMPLMTYLNLPATVRASFGLYNQQQDVDVLIEGLMTARRLFV